MLLAEILQRILTQAGRERCAREAIGQSASRVRSSTYRL